MQGFIIFDYASKYNAARKELAQWLSEGKIKRKETVIKGGLRIADKALTDLYKGINTGMCPSPYNPAISILFRGSFLC